MSYQKLSGTDQALRRLNDGAFVPRGQPTSDSQAMDAWLEAGGIPLPADIELPYEEPIHPKVKEILDKLAKDVEDIKAKLKEEKPK